MIRNPKESLLVATPPRAPYRSAANSPDVSAPPDPVAMRGSEGLEKRNDLSGLRSAAIVWSMTICSVVLVSVICLLFSLITWLQIESFRGDSTIAKLTKGANELIAAEVMKKGA